MACNSVFQKKLWPSDSYWHAMLKVEEDLKLFYVQAPTLGAESAFYWCLHT